MKALSLLQPWASLVVIGVKEIETRSWSTPYRGPLLIHASKGKAGEIFADELPFKKYITDFKNLPFGFIIGKVTLTDVIRIGTGLLSYANDETLNKLSMEEKAFGDYSPGRFAWLFKDPIIFKTLVGARGSLSLWEFNEDSLMEELG
ncbi:MAG: ASCH domain-containing protein [Ginsengibacter sp.]